MIERVSFRNLDAGLALARAMHEESEFRNLPFDDDKVARLAWNPDVFAVLWRDDNGTGQYTGAMLGFAGPHYFCDAIVARDLALFVHPDRRGGVAAIRMVREFESWAVERGAVEGYLGSSTGVAPERTRLFYEHLGYRCIGSVNKKGFANGGENVHRG